MNEKQFRQICDFILSELEEREKLVVNSGKLETEFGLSRFSYDEFLAFYRAYRPAFTVSLEYHEDLVFRPEK